jgi:hypothetical protein
MGKHTINIRLVVNSSVTKSEEPENLKKIPSNYQNKNVQIETPLVGSNRFDKVKNTSLNNPSKKLIK